MTRKLSFLTRRRRYCEVGAEDCINFVHTNFMLSVTQTLDTSQVQEFSVNRCYISAQLNNISNFNVINIYTV
jgi:hypothetical protein